MTDSSPTAVHTTREGMIERAHTTEYDVVVIGGGIAGTGIARDAAMRGLKTLLVERNDVSSGTTAGSTRLVHGGLRYLELLEFGLVFESLRERETLAEIAPHLVEPLTFIVPTYDAGLTTHAKRRLGMVLYDLLSYGKTMPRHEHLSPSAVVEREPTLPEEGLRGGFTYHDRTVAFVERLCVENVIDAVEHGGDVVNHLEAEELLTEDGHVTGIVARETLTDETFSVNARSVLNAAGPWADEVVEGVATERLVRPTKGVHLVLPSLTDHALTLPTTDDRVIFVVPWNELSLVGTTDTDYRSDPAEAAADGEDVAYLLDELQQYFPDIDESAVHYTYAAVRPLYNSGSGTDASAVSRKHCVVDHGDECAGLFSLIGAKITPYRAAAAEAVTAVETHLGRKTPCRTATTPLPGARGRWEADDEGRLSERTIDHLRGLYGSRAESVAARIRREPALAEPLCEHTQDVLAQVPVAVEEEYARTLTDVLFRRCTVGYAECEGRCAVETVAEHMAGLLDWDAERTAREIEAYERVLDRRHAFSHTD